MDVAQRQQESQQHNNQQHGTVEAEEGFLPKQ